MSEIERIESVLTRTAGRRRWQRAWIGMWQGLLAGAMVWLAVLIVYKFAPVPPVSLAVAGAVAVACILAGFLIGWFKRVTVAETARWVDGKSSLQERLSTALEVAKTDTAGPWRDLLINDAARCLDSVNPKQLLPYHLPQISRWALLVLILAAGLGFVPEYRSKAYQQKQLDAEVIKETGKRLAELTRRNLDQRPPALEPTRQALDSVVDLGEHLQRAKLTRADALKDLASVTEKIKEQARELAKNPALKSLERAARSSNKGGAAGTAELQKQIDSLQKSLGNAPADSKSIERLKKDLEQLREAAAGLPAEDSAASDAARQQLAQSLADLAKQAKDLGLSLPSLDEAMAALAAAETDQLLRDLEAAETDLEKLRAMAKALEELQMKSEIVGKDLAEQLENGQADAAQNTLEKMAERLKSGQLDSEKLAQVVDEVKRAVKPAENYGKVAQLLNQALAQMQAGQKPEASQSLEAAAKELESLMQQLADAKSMMASLDALQRAQMCIGNCQKWGKSGVPMAGKGTGIGAGVGTWADDSRWLDLDEIRERWDNSGVVRPDEDARGVSDRGDAQLADNLAPTKIRGQINPGGPMPSITLKGVSIKGASSVEFQEAVKAAQSEAQSALSQEQVPRAYRSAVRDYFDDAKQ